MSANPVIFPSDNLVQHGLKYKKLFMEMLLPCSVSQNDCNAMGKLNIV